MSKDLSHLFGKGYLFSFSWFFAVNDFHHVEKSRAVQPLLHVFFCLEPDEMEGTGVFFSTLGKSHHTTGEGGTGNVIDRPDNLNQFQLRRFFAEEITPLGPCFGIQNSGMNETLKNFGDVRRRDTNFGSEAR